MSFIRSILAFALVCVCLISPCGSLAESAQAVDEPWWDRYSQTVDPTGFTLGISGIQTRNERSHRFTVSALFLTFGYERGHDPSAGDDFQRFSLGFGMCPGCMQMGEWKTLRFSTFLNLDFIGFTAWETGPTTAYTPSIEIGPQVFLLPDLALALGFRGLLNTRTIKDSQAAVFATVAYSPL